VASIREGPQSQRPWSSGKRCPRGVIGGISVRLVLSRSFDFDALLRCVAYHVSRRQSVNSNGYMQGRRAHDKVEEEMPLQAVT
jgi:hypothetical protein